MSHAFVTIKMCYVYNQWYDISCATLYILHFFYTVHSGIFSDSPVRAAVIFPNLTNHLLLVMVSSSVHCEVGNGLKYSSTLRRGPG